MKDQSVVYYAVQFLLCLVGSRIAQQPTPNVNLTTYYAFVLVGAVGFFMLFSGIVKIIRFKFHHDVEEAMKE